MYWTHAIWLAMQFLLILSLSCGCAKKEQKNSKETPPAPVMVAEVIQKTMPVEIRTFGTVMPRVSITIKSQITGILTNINFNEGQDVKKDDLLFAVDSSLQANELKQAEAALAKDRAQEVNAQSEMRRQDELLKKGLTSQDIFDQAKAAADSLAATVKADEAVVENARIMLSYCTIRSPIDGRTGKYQVDAGNIIKANETELTTINQIKPIETSFTVPEQYLGEISRQMAATNLEVKISLPDTAGNMETGLLTFIANAVDRSTGTIHLKATFQNENAVLWPGQFVVASLTLSIEENAVVIPAQAVMRGQNGSFVFVISADQKAENRSVKVARQVENLAVISDGLKPGESVIIEGQQRVGPGAIIQVRNAYTNLPATK